MNGGCVDESAVVAFLDGGLAPEARSAVEEHVAACPSCADLVTWAAAYRSGSTVRLAGHEGRPFIGQLPPGTRVGRYQILGAVGRGGMGDVYAAYHPDLDRRIAVKVVRDADSRSDDHHARLLREARAIARLSHPNVVTVYDAGTHGDRVYIAMELIDGQTIDDWLRAAPRTWQQILDVFIAAGRGLAAAHASGIIHRDFKPQNVMIAKDGAVRVMDFGLARLTHEQFGDAEAVNDGESVATVGPVTETGAFVGTPAYMSPEQFRREQVDARSDQFSFCVALHEALLGTRPATASTDGGSPTSTGPGSSRRAVVTGWLRTIVVRGASADRERRYASMNGLLATLDRARTRPRRRMLALAAAMAVTLVSAGGWRLAHGNRFACAVPRDRLASAWSTDMRDPRRESIHRAFTISGRATAEASWQRVSKILDDYVSAWGAMYIQTCEATHVRGEQSAEVLDLRMSCLSDNLDQVRALTDALITTDVTVAAHAVSAASDLTPISRCADVTLLKSAVPLPKDEKILREVQSLKASLRDLHVLVDIGNSDRLLKQALALRPRIEALGYQPLIAELLCLIGYGRVYSDRDMSETLATFRRALMIAEASRDDLDAAKAASGLSYVAGYRLGKLEDAEFTSELAMAFLDRMGGGNERIRSWVLGDLGVVRSLKGDFRSAKALAEKSLELKLKVLGPEHPDVAIGYTQLADALVGCEEAGAALDAANRALDIFIKHGDPEGIPLGIMFANQGDALNLLRRYTEAENAFANSIQIFQRPSNQGSPDSAYAFHGLGQAKLGEGRPSDAIPPLETALRICDPDRCPPILVADIKFAFGRALWETGRNNERARVLVAAAFEAYERGKRSKRRQDVDAWRAAHRSRQLSNRRGARR